MNKMHDPETNWQGLEKQSKQFMFAHNVPTLLIRIFILMPQQIRKGLRNFKDSHKVQQTTKWIKYYWMRVSINEIMRQGKRKNQKINISALETRRFKSKKQQTNQITKIQY